MLLSDKSAIDLLAATLQLQSYKLRHKSFLNFEEILMMATGAEVCRCSYET